MNKRIYFSCLENDFNFVYDFLTSEERQLGKQTFPNTSLQAQICLIEGLDIRQVLFLSEVALYSTTSCSAVELTAVMEMFCMCTHQCTH